MIGLFCRISSLSQNIVSFVGLFRKRDLQYRPIIFAKETYNFKSALFSDVSLWRHSDDFIMEQFKNHSIQKSFNSIAGRSGAGLCGFGFRVANRKVDGGCALENGDGMNARAILPLLQGDELRVFGVCDLSPRKSQLYSNVVML